MNIYQIISGSRFGRLDWSMSWVRIASRGLGAMDQQTPCFALDQYYLPAATASVPRGSYFGVG